MGLLADQRDKDDEGAQDVSAQVTLNEQQEEAADHVYGSLFVSACPGSGKCITGDSLVLCHDGFGEIQTNPTESVRAFNSENLNQSEYSPCIKISQFVDSGIKPTLGITTSDGFSMQGTHHHPITIMNEQCELEWKELQQIKEGDVAVLHMEKMHDNPLSRHPDVNTDWYLMGMMLGDGYLTRKNEFTISTADDETENFIRKIVNELYDYEIKVYYDKRRYNLRTLGVFSKSIKNRLLEKFGKFEHLACEKHLTNEMLKGDRHELGYLIQGLFDADGYVNGASAEICLCSEKLIKQLQVILLRFGVLSVRKTKIVNEETYYRLYISGISARRFSSNIGFGLTRKQNQLENFCDKTHNSNRVIPFADTLIENIYNEFKLKKPDNYNPKTSVVTDSLGKSVRLVRYTSKSNKVKRGVTEDAAFRILDACRVAKIFCPSSLQLEFLVDNFEFSKIVKIEDGGDQHVYDYSIEGSHNFIANGFVNHNTRVIVERAARLVEKGISPRNLLCITFTNKASGEMRERLKKRLGETTKSIYISTFHGLCANILRKYGANIGYADGMSIINSDDQESIMAACARQLDFEMKAAEVRQICWAVNSIRETLYQSESEFVDAFGSDHEAKIAREYLSRLKKANQVDFSGLLSETIRLFEEDKDTLDKLQQRFQLIQVDEAQDTNLAQFRIVDMIGIHKNVVVVGDIDQCQPAGTLVRTIDGDIPIEELDESKHRLVSFDRRGSCVRGIRKGYKFKKSDRRTTENLISVKCGAFETRCTDNHKWTVKLDGADFDNSYIIYLMKSGDRWRIGKCFLYRSRGQSLCRGLGLIIRSRQEKSEASWILKVCKTNEEALAWEQILSCRYGIPTTCFEDHKRGNRSEDIIDLIYSEMDLEQLGRDAEDCLNEFGRNISFPFWKKGDSNSQKYGKRTPLLVHACNLIPECMKIPVPEKGKKFTWQSFDIDRSFYNGLVYSLDVEKYEHYIADGIITHNSIYGWRGARYDNINDFIRDNKAKVIELPLNYRSTPEILRVAEKLIRCNEGRHNVEFETTNKSGDPVEHWVIDNPDEEGHWISQRVSDLARDEGWKPEDFAVLYRANAQSRAIETGFVHRGIPYQVIGSRGFYDRGEVRDALAMLRFLMNPSDGSALARFINKPARGIGDITLGKIENMAMTDDTTVLKSLTKISTLRVPRRDSVAKDCQAMHDTFSRDFSQSDIGETLDFLLKQLDYDKYLHDKHSDKYTDKVQNLQELIDSATAYSKKNGNDIQNYLNGIALMTNSDKETKEGSVTLMTMHAAKGLEFPVVFIPSLEDGILPHARSLQGRDAEEERRLCYVAITRAEKKLITSRCKERLVRRGKFLKSVDSKPSRFLFESGILRSDDE